MLHLASDTAPGWVGGQLADLPTLLVDHAHCEKKAASTAVNLIFRYQPHAELMAPLSALAREELQHFEEVLALLAARGIPFVPLDPSPYAAGLHAAVRKREPDRLLDTLLVCGLIEARSCERMRLLSEELPDTELRTFYRSLLATEARHHATYVDLALGRWSRDEVLGRLEVLAAHEAEVVARVPVEPRMHSRA